MKEKYFLQVKANGLGIKVYLNGVPLVEEPEGFGIQETIPVNYWLMHKENSLHVQLTHPEVVSEENQTEEAQVILFVHDQSSDSPKIAKEIAIFEWPLTDVKQTFPYNWSIKIDKIIPLTLGSLLWYKTSAIQTVDESAKLSIYNLIRHVPDLIRNRNFDEAFKFLRLKYQDEAILESKPLNQIESAVKELWQFMTSIQGLKLHSVSIDDLDFSIVGRQHIVQVSRKDGAPAILFEDTDEEVFYGIPLFFANINKQWIVIR
ncbi:hypothetical protein NBRC116592_25430 [Colwellia sp. KU-HH00111]|uniref:hypothetical protein n=1 Tax=Colwellia sp. KU-HH00111 TaxID=3127652 RepID=UPI0031029177